MNDQVITPLARSRNLSIIAHIDHGRSTFADRLIQLCGGFSAREMKEQVLNSMDIERERGITIKAQTVRLDYRARDGELYELNLIDTPGHVDFAYEVKPHLAACEGSLLVVDATQGVEAQTLANVYQALDNDHEVVPVLNKIDLPAAEPDRVRQQIEDVIGLDAHDALDLGQERRGRSGGARGDRAAPAGAKGDADAPLKALLIDSWYDSYLGVVVLVRIFDGTLHKVGRQADGDRRRLPDRSRRHSSAPAGMHDRRLRDRRDRLLHRLDRTDHRRPRGRYQSPTRRSRRQRLSPASDRLEPVVFCDCSPGCERVRDVARGGGQAPPRRRSSTAYEIETSAALGFGFPLRLSRAVAPRDHPRAAGTRFDLDLIATAPQRHLSRAPPPTAR